MGDELELVPADVLPAPEGHFYSVSEIPLKTGGRRDITVHTLRPELPDATREFLPMLREFFAAVQSEADRFRLDAYTNVQALAKLEVILADVRMVRDTVKKYVAAALAEQKVRRLTVEHVITVEASSEASDRDWDHLKLVAAILERNVMRFVSYDGELVTARQVAESLLRYGKLDWRLTPLRDDGIDPDDFSTQKVDEDTGKVVRTPTLRIIDNSEKHI